MYFTSMLVVQLGEVQLDRRGLGVWQKAFVVDLQNLVFCTGQPLPTAGQDLTCLPYRSEMLREWGGFCPSQVSTSSFHGLMLKLGCARRELLAAEQLSICGQS
jgi:hypothetical protein